MNRTIASLNFWRTCNWYELCGAAFKRFPPAAAWYFPIYLYIGRANSKSGARGALPLAAPFFWRLSCGEAARQPQRENFRGGEASPNPTKGTLT